MFEDFFKRMTKGFGATMFLITLPVVMLVVGLLCYTILGKSMIDIPIFLTM